MVGLDVGLNNSRDVELGLAVTESELSGVVGEGLLGAFKASLIVLGIVLMVVEMDVDMPLVFFFLDEVGHLVALQGRAEG